MKEKISNYFGLIIIISGVIGFIVPSIGELTSILIPFFLAVVIFSSFFQLDFTPKSLYQNTRKILIFYILRYLLLPTVMYFVLQPLPVFYSTSIVLILLLPGAVSAPAFTKLFGGNFDFSLANTFFTNCIAPIIIPYACFLFFQKTVTLDQQKMFLTLFYTIILPLILHFPLRKNKKFNKVMHDNNSVITIICISITMVFVIAKYKTEFYQNYHLLPLYILFSMAIYASMYLFGWILASKKDRKEKISSLLSSGANNIGLGVTITILYFPPEINIFFIISQILWSVYLIPIKWLLIKKQGSINHSH